MASTADRYPDNIAGPFYVDSQCIDCDLCRHTAPCCFTRHDDGGYSFVFKQPEDETQFDACMEALEGCPVDAIGKNGDLTSDTLASLEAAHEE